MSGAQQVVPIDVRLMELEARVERLTSELAEAPIPAVSALSSVSPADGAGDFASLDEWVDGYFSTLCARPIGGEFRWCSRWAEHPEALARLNALWSSWTSLQADAATGMATWFTSYLDPQLAILLSRSGPFAQCRPDRHEGPPPLASGSDGRSGSWTSSGNSSQKASA